MLIRHDLGCFRQKLVFRRISDFCQQENTPSRNIPPGSCPACLPVCSVTSVVSDSAMLWTVAHQAPQSMGFSRQESCRGWPCPSPGDLPNPGANPHHLHCRRILYQLSHQGSQEAVSFPYKFRLVYKTPPVTITEEGSTRKAPKKGVTPEDKNTVTHLSQRDVLLFQQS